METPTSARVETSPVEPTPVEPQPVEPTVPSAPQRPPDQNAEFDAAYLRAGRRVPAGFSDEFASERLARLERYQSRLAEVLRDPGVEQRTPEWYEARKRVVTASEAAQALGFSKFVSSRQFYRNKCGYQASPFVSSRATRWGVTFEPVALGIYTRLTHAAVHPFGLVQHHEVPFLGASPDGINELGVMVEIKCPLSRRLNGTVPEEYRCQMALQMDACGLEECDYFECRFVDLDDRPLAAVSHRGIIVFASELDRATYGAVESYGETYDTSDAEQARAFEERSAAVAASPDESRRALRWGLEQYDMVREYRDPTRAIEMRAALGEVWGKVLAYRADRAAFDRDIPALREKEPEFEFRGADTYRDTPQL